MAYDLSGVQKQAQEVKEQAAASSTSSEFKVIYTQKGSISLRLLFNPKSGVVMRQIRRHRVGNEQVICLANYNQDCPVCSAIDEAESVTGGDLWRLKSGVRCIFFAQYVESDYSWTDRFPEPDVGDVILVMAPWSVYSALNSLIAESGDNVTKLLTEYEGMVVDIKRVDAGRVTYTTGLKPFAAPFKSANDQQEFDQLLESLDNLNDIIVPPAISQEIIDKANQTATALKGEYVSPLVKDNQPQSGMNFGQFSQPQQSVWSSETTQPTQPAQPAQSATQTPPEQEAPQEVQPASTAASDGLLPQNGDTKVNPVTGQVFEYENGQWISTGETRPTDMNGGSNE